MFSTVATAHSSLWKIRVAMNLCVLECAASVVEARLTAMVRASLDIFRRPLSLLHHTPSPAGTFTVLTAGVKLQSQLVPLGVLCFL